MPPRYGTLAQAPKFEDTSTKLTIEELMDPGTWTELAGAFAATGVALALGVMAYAQGKKANFWAQQAAAAQERANELTEAGLPIEFTAEIEIAADWEDEEGRYGFDAYLSVGLPKGSGSVWLHDVETIGALFRPVPNERGPVFSSDLFARRPLEIHGPEEKADVLPNQLHGGESIEFFQPWPSFRSHPERGSWARILVHYSVALESTIKDMETNVELPPPINPPPDKALLTG